MIVTRTKEQMEAFVLYIAYPGLYMLHWALAIILGRNLKGLNPLFKWNPSIFEQKRTPKEIFHYSWTSRRYGTQLAEGIYRVGVYFSYLPSWMLDLKEKKAKPRVMVCVYDYSSLEDWCRSIANWSPNWAT